jgi:hypothetical protein
MGQWDAVDGTQFNVRMGPDYSSTKLKAPSAPTLYETFAVDIFRTSKKAFHIARAFELEEIKQELVSTLPSVIIVNILCPIYAPPMFSSQTDGEGFSMVIFCRLTECTRKIISAGETSPAIQLLERFVSQDADVEMRSRFKCIPKALNTDELNLGRILSSLIKSYNATPFLTACGQQVHYFLGQNYFEIDLDIHRFSSLARNGFFHVKHMIPKIEADFTFLVEGRSNEELPEQLLGGFKAFGIKYFNSEELDVASLEN